MERVSEEILEELIDDHIGTIIGDALTELRERREKDAPCPEHAKILKDGVSVSVWKCY